MFVIIAKHLIPKGYSGVTLFPFIITGNPLDKEDLVFMNHEKIHIRQQLELLIFPFFIWYFTEYLFRLYQFKNHHKAYRNISFEREAYQHEANLEYLKKRSFWAFLTTKSTN